MILYDLYHYKQDMQNTYYFIHHPKVSQNLKENQSFIMFMVKC